MNVAVVRENPVGTAPAVATQTDGSVSVAERDRHAAIMAQCDAALDAILAVAPVGSPIFYVDYPLHLNVGDQLINQGAEAFFRRAGYRIRGRLCFHDLCDWPDTTKPHIVMREPVISRLLALPKDTIFVFHGGGNLGDLYLELNAMREQLVARLADYRVVVLPQSIHFRAPETERACLSSLLRHPDFHIFVRDEPSLAAIRRIDPQAGALLPDMAHALWPVLQTARNRTPTRKTLRMARQDVEAAGTGQAAAGGTTEVETIDWDSLLTPADRLAYRLLRKQHHAAPFGFSPTATHRLWYRFRDHMVRRAVDLFSQYAMVESDRLHGMILASLLGRPTGFSDNTYGKVSRYHACWLAGSPILRPLQVGSAG